MFTSEKLVCVWKENVHKHGLCVSDIGLHFHTILVHKIESNPKTQAMVGKTKVARGSKLRLLIQFEELSITTNGRSIDG